MYKKGCHESIKKVVLHKNPLFHHLTISATKIHCFRGNAVFQDRLHSFLQVSYKAPAVHQTGILECICAGYAIF